MLADYPILHYYDYFTKNYKTYTHPKYNLETPIKINKLDELADILNNSINYTILSSKSKPLVKNKNLNPAIISTNYYPDFANKYLTLDNYKQIYSIVYKLIKDKPLVMNTH